MKRIILIMLTVLAAAVLFSGCADAERVQSGRISIVATIFPQYDWVRQIIGEENTDRFELTFLLNNRIDLHSYNPTVQDITKIKTSNVFIYVGGHSDAWTKDVLAEAASDIVVINLLETLGDSVILDEHGCGADCEEDHDHVYVGADGHDGLYADEHFWVSLRRVKIICAALADVLAEIDPDNAQSYKNNLEAYTAKLAALDAEYQAVADAAAVNTLVFADRFPFRYMMNDYGLDHYAAFQGCSAESEVSFVTIISLANRINRLGLNTVMVTETSDQSIAQTVIANTETKNQRILVLDSLKSVTSADDRNGVTYLSVMQNNLEVLREALK
jgi:zinc transport system substrate-binding protein